MHSSLRSITFSVHEYVWCPGVCVTDGKASSAPTFFLSTCDSLSHKHSRWIQRDTSCVGALSFRAVFSFAKTFTTFHAHFFPLLHTGMAWDRCWILLLIFILPFPCFSFFWLIRFPSWMFSFCYAFMRISNISSVSFHLPGHACNASLCLTHSHFSFSLIVYPVDH